MRAGGTRTGHVWASGHPVDDRTPRREGQNVRACPAASRCPSGPRRRRSRRGARRRRTGGARGTGAVRVGVGSIASATSKGDDDQLPSKRFRTWTRVPGVSPSFTGHPPRSPLCVPEWHDLWRSIAICGDLIANLDHSERSVRVKRGFRGELAGFRGTSAVSGPSKPESAARRRHGPLPPRLRWRRPPSASSRRTGSPRARACSGYGPPSP